MADDLREILDIAKREMDDVPQETWARLERIIRLNFGAQRAYIAAQKKGRHLAALEAAGDQDVGRVASMLRLSVRRVQQLKSLNRDSTSSTDIDWEKRVQQLKRLNRLNRLNRLK